jgi:hypothetical protein
MKYQIAYGKTARPTVDTGKGLTEQAHKNECDMNVILRDYQRTGFIKHAKEHEGRYDDVSAVDFQQAMITVANVKSMFEELPANFRKEFENNPSNFLAFAQDPNNGPMMQEMGIIRGNDGFDVSGATVKTPTEASMALKAAQEAAQAATQAPVSEPVGSPKPEQAEP